MLFLAAENVRVGARMGASSATCAYLPCNEDDFPGGQEALETLTTDCAWVALGPRVLRTGNNDPAACAPKTRKTQGPLVFPRRRLVPVRSISAI